MTHQHVQRSTPHIILIGPPGSGKSTIAEHLMHYLAFTTISTGERLRAEVASGSQLGREVKDVLDQGHLVSDDLMNRLMHDWLTGLPPDQGFLLDGYPRSLSQAQALIAMLHAINRSLDAVIALEIGTDDIVQRLSGRRICEGGGEAFTLHISDTEAVQRCHERGGKLVQRDDDQPDVIQERLRAYHEETQPLLDFYAEQGLLRTVDAHDTPGAITTRVLTLLQARG